MNDYIAKTEKEWHKKISSQWNKGGFLLDGTRAVDELAVADWLTSKLRECYEMGKTEPKSVDSMFLLKDQWIKEGYEKGVQDAIERLKKIKVITVFEGEFIVKTELLESLQDLLKRE